MKSKVFTFILFGVLLLSLSFLGSVAAQEPISTPEPTLTIDDPTPTPEPTFPAPISAPTEEGEQIFGLAVAVTPQPPDPDCSDGQCVFWVGSGSDDAGTDPYGGACLYRVNANEIYLGQCPYGQNITSGFRFPNVTLPQGAQIAEAYLEFTVDGPYSDDLTVAFYGENRGNAQPFSSFSRPENRPLTQASATWHIPSSDHWELGQIRTSPDLTAIVQEIVNRPDWASGNGLAIIVRNAGPASGPNRHRRVIGYERPVWYPGRENAARLVVRLSKPVSVEILDSQGNAVNAQNLNADGWPTPNPLTVKVTLTCPAEGFNCDYYPFTLNIGFEGAPGRFYLYDASLMPDGSNCYGDSPAIQPTYQTFTLSCNSISLYAGDTITHTWTLWVRPSTAVTLSAEATYGGDSDEAWVSVPRASIYPVVVIPGILGSWKNFSGEWVIDPLLGTYDNLLEELRLVGYEDGVSLFTFPYDWRQPLETTGSELGTALDGFLAQAAARPYVRTDKVDIIAHSMGGLVSRAYIQGNGYRNNARRLITLGTPHLGAPSTYLMAEGLEFQGIEGPILRMVAQSQAKKSGYCTWVYPPPWSDGVPVCIVTNSDFYRYVQQQIPTVRQLFPDRRYLSSNPGGYLISVANPTQIYPYGVQVNGFLEGLNGNVGILVSRLGVQGIIPVVGNGKRTDSYYRVIPPLTNQAPLWANGKVPQNSENVQFREQASGDGTVPSASANLGLVDSRISSLFVTRADDGQQDVEHRHLPTQLQLSTIERLIGLRPPFDAGFSDPLVRNPILIRNLSPVEMQVIDPLGRRAGVDFDTRSELTEIPTAAFWRSDVPGEPDFLFIREPLPGTYTIRLLGIAEGQYTVGMESLSEQGSVTVGEFSGQSMPGARYEHQIHYDPAALPALPLTITWLPPLREDETLSIQFNRTLPIKFSLRDAAGHFVADENVLVWIVDMAAPGTAVARFTTQGSNRGRSDAVRIDSEAAMYIVNLRLRDYGLQAGKTYLVGVTAFGQHIGSAVFAVRP